MHKLLKLILKVFWKKIYKIIAFLLHETKLTAFFLL